MTASPHIMTAEPHAEPAPAVYRICVRCVMDTSDRDITFDSAGVCNHCAEYERQAKRLRLDDAGQDEFKRTLADVKASGRGSQYDCVVGVSGGVDSTYAAYVAKSLGLRPLAVHLDNGWNSELAVNNIERVLARLDIDLYTHVLDWEEFRDLQLAFLKASVPDGEIPTDHAIVAALYQAAARHGCRYIINGANAVTEGVLPVTWTYGVSDWRYIKSIHRQFGRRPLRRFPHYTLGHLYWYIGVRRLRSLWILDHVPYVKAEAKRILAEELGWRDYGGKHYESVYTRFFQGYILPVKFGIDKRRSHLSTLICSGQISRDAAVEELKKPPYPAEMQCEDRAYVIKKLELSEMEFERLMRLPPRTFEQYPNRMAYTRWIRLATKLARGARLLPRR
jgi:N-acetyl sugar amidotransferase